jgi:hypothetical protein
MRAASQLYVFACMLTLLFVGCSAADPVGPGPAQREAVPAGDPCYPNASPC